MAMPIIWPRFSIPVEAAIRERAATHAIPPAMPCTKRATSNSQYGPPVANSRVAATRTISSVSRGPLGPRRSTTRPVKSVATIIAAA